MSSILATKRSNVLVRRSTSNLRINSKLADKQLSLFNAHYGAINYSNVRSSSQVHVFGQTPGRSPGLVAIAPSTESASLHRQLARIASFRSQASTRVTMVLRSSKWDCHLSMDRARSMVAHVRRIARPPARDLDLEIDARECAT